MGSLEKSVTDRTRGIGGSDVGSLFGLNKWMPLPRLWLQKVGRLPNQKNEENEFQEWGKLLEAPIARRYAEKAGRRIKVVKDTLVHPEFPWMIGNPDRLQWDTQRPKRQRRGVLEVKATMFGNMKSWQQGGVPATYYLQLQHYLCITGLSWGSFAVLFGGNKLVQFDVQRDEALIAVMIQREREFWELVLSRTPPRMTLSAEWNESLAAFFPTGEKAKEITLSTPEAIGHARRLFALAEQIKRRTAEMDQHEAWIKQQIGEANAQRLLIPGVGRFNWTIGERRSINLDKLRANHAAIAEALTEVAPQRRLMSKALEQVSMEEEVEEPTEAAVYGLRRMELD